MEPMWAACRPKRMFADTDAVRALGAANAAQADDLAGIAATLSALTVTAAGSSLGPVAAPFLSALSEAAAEEARAIGAISDRLACSGETVNAVASAYDSADSNAGGRIAGV